jgi:exosortase
MALASASSNAPGLWLLVRDALKSREGTVTVAGMAVSLGLLGVAYADNFRHFFHTWMTDENYSHGFLVPLLSLYFANEAAKRGPIPNRMGVGGGIVLIGLSVVGRLVTIVVPVGVAGDVSLLLGLAGVVSLITGAESLRRFRFALLFLIFMVPLPIALYSAIASPLQLLVSRIAAGVLNAINIPVLCEGNEMTLPGGLRMFVAEACSGMRQMTGFLALTTAVAYLSNRPAWHRFIMVAASMPIALTANLVRVVLTGVIMYHVHPKFASGAFHTLEGLLMMGFGLGLLMLLRAALNLLSSPTAQAEPAMTPRPPTDSTDSSNSSLTVGSVLARA